MTEFDAIVIGSGLGGLTTAAYLTTNGIRTLVLEQYDTVGGCSHVFRRKGTYEFDVGLHYIGDCAPGGGIPTILRGVGLEGRVEFNELDPDGFSTIVMPGLTFRVPRGWDEYRRRLLAAFPSEKRGLRVCTAILERIGREIDGNQVPTQPKQLATLPLRQPLTTTLGMLPLKWLFDACRVSDRARLLLCSESGDYATPPSRAPIAMHAALMHHFLKSGAYYPKGGGQMLAANLLDVIQTHGGRVRTQAKVERIHVQRGRATGVTLETGETLHAPVIVSGADIKRTYNQMVGREHISSGTRKRIDGYRMAAPLFTVYLGLNIDLADRMPDTQYWAFQGTDIEEIYRDAAEGKPDRTHALYITSATLKDPRNAQLAPKGHSVLELMTIVPAQHEYWQVGEGPAAGERYSRNTAYQDVKEQLTDELIELANRLIPGLVDHIVWREASTPITQQRYTLSTLGSCYGIELATDQFGPRRPGAKTEIAGLYLTGASTTWGHGIFGAMNGGVGTAGAILKRNLFAEIRSGKVFADTSRLTARDEHWDPLLACRRLAEKPRSKQREYALERA
jgi:phytoene dehydrogenase-like protein